MSLSPLDGASLRHIRLPGDPVLWFRAKCPIAADEQRWVDDISWLADSFGTSWLHSPVVLSTDDFFPAAHAGTEAGIRHAVDTVREHMKIESLPRAWRMPCPLR